MRATRMKRYGATVAGLTCLSCYGEIGQVEPGLVSLQLQPDAAVHLAELEYTVTHETGFVRSGPVAIGEKQSFSFKVDTLPPAAGYEVTAFARGQLTRSKQPTVCTGYATFEIKAAQATSLMMSLQCDAVGRAQNSCPGASAIAASPSAVAVGQEMLLSADVPEDKDGPQPLQLTWSADSGIFTSPSEMQTRFRCSRPGVVDVELSISDGDEDCDAMPASISVICMDRE